MTGPEASTSEQTPTEKLVSILELLAKVEGDSNGPSRLWGQLVEEERQRRAKIARDSGERPGNKGKEYSRLKQIGSDAVKQTVELYKQHMVEGIALELGVTLPEGMFDDHWSHATSLEPQQILQGPSFDYALDKLTDQGNNT